MLIHVVAFLDDLPLGAEFEPGEQPVHLTLVPRTSTDAELGQLEAAIESALAAFGPLEIEGGDDELFGPDHDVEVTLVEDDGTLASVHRELLRALRPLGMRVLAPPFVGAGFRPHVTVRGDERIERGERLTLDAVALLTRDDGPWRLVAQFPRL
ncbi:MAG: 2'-5' RNA ligase family protein [Micrococcales bacterium]|nr:2'-5' RNA ligase family protein [Micrococcales bacterium]